MYSAAREFEDREVSPQRLLDVVWDVAAYPEFLKGIARVEVEAVNGDSKRARFTVTVAGMEFEYTLVVEREDHEVRWKRISGSFRHAEGSMTHLGDGSWRYKQALDPGFAVPGFAVRFVLERSLPRLIREFLERAKQGDE